MSQRTKIAVCLSFAILLAGVQSAQAMFEVIVPAEIQYGTTDNSAIDVTYWGWLVATADTLTLADLQNVTFTGAITDPAVTVHPQFFLNDDLLAPLSPGQIAGLRTVGRNDAAYDPFVYAGEALKDSTMPFWQAGFEWPEGHVSTATFTGLVTIGADTLGYSTIVHMGEFDTQIAAGQRIPEPATIMLLTLGGLAILRRGRKSPIPDVPDRRHNSCMMWRRLAS